MKFLSTLALVAVLLMICDAAVPIQGWLWSSSENKTQTQAQTIDELPSADEEKAVDQLDQDYENANAKPSQAKLDGSQLGNEDDKMKFDIDESIPTSNIETVNELTPQNQTNFVAYDRTPAQSPFVDGAPHPTHSQGIDPRFVNRQRKLSINLLFF